MLTKQRYSHLRPLSFLHTFWSKSARIGDRRPQREVWIRPCYSDIIMYSYLLNIIVLTHNDFIPNDPSKWAGSSAHEHLPYIKTLCLYLCFLINRSYIFKPYLVRLGVTIHGSAFLRIFTYFHFSISLISLL